MTPRPECMISSGPRENGKLLARILADRSKSFGNVFLHTLNGLLYSQDTEKSVEKMLARFRAMYQYGLHILYRTPRM